VPDGVAEVDVVEVVLGFPTVVEFANEEVVVVFVVAESCWTTTQLPNPAVVVKEAKQRFPDAPPTQRVPTGRVATISWV